jgi:sulfonate transport system substrate-binding protein
MRNSLTAKIHRVFVKTIVSPILVLVALAPFALTQNADDVVRIGYQKYGTLVLLKARGSLEKRLAPLHVEVKWTEFPAGPQLLEGLNVGSIDFGIAGEAPPIFAQAAGADLVYVGNEPPASAGEAILVPRDSPIKTVAELKGKKVALNKGSNVHFLLVKMLERAGVNYKDIDTIFLTPADARAAFERGCVGDLGAVSRGGAKANRCSHSRRWQRCSQQSPVLSCRAVLRKKERGRDCHHH